MRNRWTQLGGPLLILASLCALGASSWSMAQRLSHRPELANRPQFWFLDHLPEEDFKFLDIPGHVERVFDPPGGDPRTSALVALVVHWRGQSARFDVGGRDESRLPGMLRDEDWFQLLPMVEGRARDQRELLELFKQGKTRPRLIAAARYPAEGYDAQTWGLVRRSDWRYRFAELKADGPADSSIQTWETTYNQIERVVAPGPHDPPPAPISDEDRRTFEWQYAAMTQITPPTLFRAKDKVVDQGMRAMSWTWPVAGASVMGLVVGVMLTFARRVERSDTPIG